MPRLCFSDSGETICEITEEQLDFLRDLLEGDDAEEKDYYINQDTIDMLAEEGCEPKLIEQLKAALGDKEDMDIRCE